MMATATARHPNRPPLIEKGKPWALDIARAISVLDPNSVDQYLYVKRPEEDERTEKTTQPPNDRLAA